MQSGSQAGGAHGCPKLPSWAHTAGPETAGDATHHPLPLLHPGPWNGSWAPRGLQAPAPLERHPPAGQGGHAGSSGLAPAPDYTQKFKSSKRLPKIRKHDVCSSSLQSAPASVGVKMPQIPNVQCSLHQQFYIHFRAWNWGFFSWFGCFWFFILIRKHSKSGEKWCSLSVMEG